MSKSVMELDHRDLAVGRPYPERADREPAVHDRVAEFLAKGLIQRPFRRLRDPVRALMPIVEYAAAHENALRILSDEELRLQASAIRTKLRNTGFASVGRGAGAAGAGATTGAGSAATGASPGARRLVLFSTTTCLVRPWLKLWRTVPVSVRGRSDKVFEPTLSVLSPGFFVSAIQ